MPDKNFLEEYSLFKKVNLAEAYPEEKIKYLPKPPINMYCKQCDSEQTFKMLNQYDELGEVVYPETIKANLNLILRVKYGCAACGESQHVFYIRFIKKLINEGKENEEEKYFLQKVFQDPPREPSVDKNLKKTLGKDIDYYKKGLISESQGYGIAAFAYFRRIIENIIDDLLSMIPNLMEDEEKEKYMEALEKTKKEHVAADKIKLVKDLIPKVLMPDDQNPLSIIYGVLSNGLHKEEDDDCLEKAEIIRSSLVFLVRQIKNTQSESKDFTQRMKNLLEKKS